LEPLLFCNKELLDAMEKREENKECALRVGQIQMPHSFKEHRQYFVAIAAHFEQAGCLSTCQ
jgi:hypothetical protein